MWKSCCLFADKGALVRFPSLYMDHYSCEFTSCQNSWFSSLIVWGAMSLSLLVWGKVRGKKSSHELKSSDWAGQPMSPIHLAMKWTLTIRKSFTQYDRSVSFCTSYWKQTSFNLLNSTKISLYVILWYCQNSWLISFINHYAHMMHNNVQILLFWTVIIDENIVYEA